MDAFPKLQELTFSSESSQSELTFFQDLMKNVLEQRRSGELCDIIIKVQNDKLHCHKSILGANSPYFYSMFTSDFGERGLKEIDLSASFSSVAPLSAIFDFMYTGQLKIDDDIFEEVLNGGTLFLMDSIRGHCAHYMLVNLGMHNVFTIWEFTERYFFASLGKICKSVATEHLQDCFLQCKDLSSVCPNILELIINEVGDLLDEKDLCSLLTKWIQSDKLSRQKQLKDILMKNKEIKYFSLCMKLVSADFELGTSLRNVETTQRNLPTSTCEEQLMATREYIVFHKIEETLTGHCMVNIFAHCGKQRMMWYLLAEIKLDPLVAHSITHIIGFLGYKVVFGTVDGGKVKMIDLKTNEASTVSLLEEDGVNDIRRTILYSCFCFDNRLFCIEKNKNNYFFRCAYTLKQYNPAIGMWSMVSELPLTDMEQRDEVEFQVVVLRDEVLILASLYGYPHPMLNQRAFNICFLVRKSPGNYDVIHYVSHTAIVHGTMENTSYVITVKKDPHENESFVLLQASRSDLEYPGSPVEFKLSSSLEYNTATAEWKPFMGSFSKLCLPNPENSVPLRFNDKIQCSSVVTAGEGCIYQTRVLCPYISELWVLILSGKQEWQKVCCCPADLRSTRVTVCHVPPGLQTELQPATFLDPGKNCQVGPMLVYRLPDVNSRIQNSDEPDVHIYDIDRCYGKATFNVDSDSESECGILGAVTVPHRYVADTDSASDSELDVEVNHAVIVGLNISDSD